MPTTLRRAVGLGAATALVSGAFVGASGTVAHAAQANGKCSATWKAATSGDWSVASNWSPAAVPTSSSTVCITLAGAYTVTVSDFESAGSVTLGAASGTQPALAVAGKGGNGGAQLNVADDVSNVATISLTSTGNGAAPHAELTVGER